MAGRIPDNIIEDILARTDIVETIASYIPLKRAGRNFKANCPFHNEKTPSFMVSPERQIYHCFGCGAGGNVFGFLMQYERLEFSEAVELLAKRAGVVLPERQKRDYKAEGVITQIHAINESATLFYQSNLNSGLGAQAKKYILDRGIKESSIQAFKLGYAADRYDALINYLRAKDISLALLEKAGLILPKDGGGYYDRFRARVIFPIFDIKSRTIAFGARFIPAQDAHNNGAALAKYINSPETPVYIKGRNLYGLNFAKDAIRQFDSVAVVEGYFDFIIPYQEGLQNIVASQGTALTLEQVRLIKRYTRNVVMVYDSDSAGQMAALRSLDIFIEEEMNVRVASLPAGFDPDLFVRKKGIENFRKIISGGQNLFDYKMDMLKKQHNIREIEGKAKVASEMLPTINRFKDAILKSQYLKKLSEELDVQTDALLEELKKIKPDRLHLNFDTAGLKKKQEINPTEMLLLKLMLEENGLITQVKERLEPADFQDDRASRIVSALFNLTDEGKNIEPNRLIASLGDEVSDIICSSVFLPAITEGEREKVVDDCILRLKNNRLRQRRQHIHEEIKIAQDSGDEEKLHRLMQEFHYLIKKG